MRIFHLSDLHLGIKLFQKDLLEDQRYILKEIVELAKQKQPDVCILAGDIYDKSVPSVEAIQVFQDFVYALRKAVPGVVLIGIAGNHDSGMRLESFRSILQKEKVYMIGTPPETETDYIERIDLEDTYGTVHFYALPFVRPSMVKDVLMEEGLSYEETMQKLLERETLHTEERNVFISHQFYVPTGRRPEEVERADSEVRTVGNIDEISSRVLLPFDYAALGHIHKPMKAGKEIFRYCGTPLPYSLSEANQKKQILCVDMKEKGNVEITPLFLHPLHAVREIRGTLQEVLAESCDDYVSVVLSDEKDYAAFELQERLSHAFENLLTIRNDTSFQSPDTPVSRQTLKDPFTLVREFLPDIDEEDAEILQEVLNEAFRKEAL